MRHPELPLDLALEKAIITCSHSTRDQTHPPFFIISPVHGTELVATEKGLTQCYSLSNQKGMMSPHEVLPVV